MSKNNKKKKILNSFKNLIEHDFGFYNPVWRWDKLPSEIKDNYSLIKDTLDMWEDLGYIRIFMNGEERMIEIITVPKDIS